MPTPTPEPERPVEPPTPTLTGPRRAGEQRVEQRRVVLRLVEHHVVEGLQLPSLGPANAVCEGVHRQPYSLDRPLSFVDLVDVAEVAAIRRAFGDEADHMAVSGTKSMTGHLLGAAGALESVFAALAAHHRVAPPTVNITDLDPAVTLDVVRDEPRPLGDGDLVVLNNSFGFGGTNAHVVLTEAPSANAASTAAVSVTSAIAPTTPSGRSPPR